MRAQKLTRRFVSPPSLAPGLELIHQPLYSSGALNAAALPREVLFFNYAIGQTISGAGAGALAANRFHTNMETANFLSSPKTFTVGGVRLVILPLSYGASPALSDDTAVGAVNSDMFDDLQLIHGTGEFQLTVGPKTYCEGPLFLIPANVGIEGVAQSDGFVTGAAAGTAAESWHSVGRYYAMPTYPVLIANQQSFGARLSFLWPTNPTIIDTKLVQVFLDGLMGREVS